MRWRLLKWAAGLVLALIVVATLAGAYLFYSRHADLFRRREAPGPLRGSARLARRLWRAAHLRRLDGRRSAGSRLPACERAAIPDGDPAPRRSGTHGRDPRRGPSGRRQVHPYARLLPGGADELFVSVALGAEAPDRLRRRSQRLPREPQGRAAARVLARRRPPRALEACRFARLGKAFVAPALQQLQARGVARPSQAETRRGTGRAGCFPP